MIFNIENITHYLKDEQALKQADAEALKQFVQQYPYSGLLQLVYCKYLHLHNDVRLEAQLEQCALVVNDRKRVYELLFQPTLQEQITEHDELLNTSPEEKEIESKVNETSSLEDTTTVSATEKTTLPTPEIANEEQEPEEKEKEKEKEKEREQAKTLDELEKNILTEAVNASIQVDISEYQFDDETPQKEKPVQLEEEKLETERSFVNWFDKPSTPPQKTKTTKTIIDDFLNANNTEKNKKEVFSPSNMAKMSLVANNQFVTETLATIYAKQGQIDKAIEIYQQLSLKNPEKKTFFASRIRFLKEKQQHNK
ncbi:MAG: hypothetical protein N4A35_02410 [Flavobacteriales bacterium]|nr:hypothetical protein [Flavobacteriales bacterium]